MFSFFKKKPLIVKRKDHCISRKNIDHDALSVLYRLSHAGYRAYLVGGGVRDLLLGREPKDFDVGTNAKPNEVKRLFRNCFLVGRRFRLAHVVFGKKVIETSTFRRTPKAEEVDADDPLQRDDNTFGTPEEDARRRDFTINGLFYDISDFSVIDYVGGLKDLKRGILRAIGEADVRFREDPVRMMRAIKFSSRLEFTLERKTKAALFKWHADILKSSAPRICEEIFRLFSFGSSERAFRLCWECGMLADLFPRLDAYVRKTGGKKSDLWRYLAALDADLESADVSNGTRYAALFYPLYQAALKEAEAAEGGGRGRRRVTQRTDLLRKTMSLDCCAVPVPKMTVMTARLMFEAPGRFRESPESARGRRFLCHPDFLDMMAMTRIVCAAEGKAVKFLEPWKKAYKKLLSEGNFSAC